MADERTHTTSLGATFSNNLAAMATSVAQSHMGTGNLRGGVPSGMANSQLVQALGHDYSSLRPPFIPGTPNQNELAAQSLVQHMLQVNDCKSVKYI